MFYKVFPGLKQLIYYQSSNLKGDLSAAIIVSILFIPQSMAYAVIAGVPIVMGLYAATIPLIIYALFGSSNYLSVGPISIVSLLAFSGVSSIAKPNTNTFLELIIVLAFIIGFLQLTMGLMKTGKIFDYISPLVVQGFTSAVAIIIALNQIKSLMGVSLPKYENLLIYSSNIYHKLPDINFFTLSIGIGSFLFLLLLKRIPKITFLGPLFLVVASTLLVRFFDLHLKGVATIGSIPKGLPQFSVNLPTLEIFQLLFPIAFMIAIISFLESYAVVKTLASKKKEKINSNQELVGLGLANISSSFIGAIPVGGALSRTAVNYNSGAKSNLSLLLTAILVLISLQFLTPLFYYLPMAALASIIIIAVSHLINLREMVDLIKARSKATILFFITFFSTLMIDIFYGLVIGILLSMLMFIQKIRII
ncbi:SulP family inorganic anion transporter [Anaerobacillus alkaliphilus]|uniref:SulP family inorganic anion transporter n=1 Tax=Anaerobacillus alkaliphilus TaxID=1548597 RepID=UPI0013754D73|nr:SulP family inorganic anion transporter [Anaerobacillus alkaliphilus]